ncbi:GNAT family N-acetyltransferase [Natronorarus salvus]|uniref:GNAT family N-acetyltransferase n=1 Tax=Natronorarus salvus TaxID=3117733 RepID=UPI002F25FD76
MDELEIREARSESVVDALYPIVSELRDLEREEYRELYAAMREEGYHLFGGFVDDEPIAAAGVRVGTNFYLGRHAYVYDLVVTETERSKGHGSALLSFVNEWATERECEAVELESGLWREEAHRFYERNGYEKYCFSFVYELA